jgi:acyl-CoA thioester hydrolase
MKNAFKIPIQVRFRDIDLMGHVNNAVFFSYFEMARAAFHLAHVSKTLERESSSFILAHAGCDYIKPIVLGTDLIAHMGTANFGKKSFQFVYSLTDGADESIVYAKGVSVQVCYDYTRNTSIEIPPDFRKVLLQFQCEDQT